MTHQFYAITVKALMLLAILTSAFAPLAASAHEGDPQTPTSSTVIELAVLSYSFIDNTEGDTPCQLVKVPEAVDSGHAGQPNLPWISRVVAIPALGEPRLTILEAETVTLPGVYHLCPTPTPQVRQTKDGPEFDGAAYLPDPAIYEQNAFFPARPAEILTAGFMRDQRLAQVGFSPFAYNPVTGELRYTRTIKVQIDMVSSQNRPAAAAPALTAPVWNSNTYKLEVNQDGLYRLSPADLQAYGINTTAIDPRTFQLYNQNSEVAVWVTGADDGRFDSTDRLSFYGQALNSVYTTTNIYWLTWGQAAGQAMPTRSGVPSTGQTVASTPASALAEQDVFYVSNYPTDSGDAFYWGDLYAGASSVSGSYTVQIASLYSASPYSITLSGRLQGYSAAPFHHTRVYLNNRLVNDATWNATAQYNFAVQLPQSYLVEGANTVKVELPRDLGITNEELFVDRFEVAYQRSLAAASDRLAFTGAQNGDWRYQVTGFSGPAVEVFDITDTSHPVRLTETTATLNGSTYTLAFEQAETSARRYLAVGPNGGLRPNAAQLYQNASLKSTANAADYLVITYAGFYTDVLPLANHRAAEGLRVKVVTTQAIYDEFNNGVYHPDAIRDFLSYTYTNWQKPAPRYVLLVGDGNYDPRNYMGRNEVSFVPAYILPVDPYITLTASDNRYVTVNGNDNFPDMAIGRLNVHSRAETTSMVNKIIAYETTPLSSDWNSKVLMAADDADSGGYFPSYSDAAMTLLPTGYAASKVYYLVTHTTAASARSAIISGINQGALLVNYVGHGAYFTWGSEQFLNTTYAGSLTNAGKLPLFFNAACLTGYFHNPSSATKDNASLAEALVRPANTGAIAVIGSTGMGLAYGQDYLNRGLYQAIFRDGYVRVGDAFWQSKRFLYANTVGYGDLLDAFTLFGDPALKLKVRPADVSISYKESPREVAYTGDEMTYSMVFSNTGSALATHVRIDNLISSGLKNVQVTAEGLTLTPVDGQAFSWNVEDMAPGTTGKITVTGEVVAAAGETVTNQASISTAILDQNNTNNQAGPLDTAIVAPTSVEVSRSSAQFEQGVIRISWTTDSERILTGFNIYRSETSNGLRQRLNSAPISAQNPGAVQGAEYSFIDDSLQPGQYYFYWIELLHPNYTAMLSALPVQAGYLQFIAITRK